MSYAKNIIESNARLRRFRERFEDLQIEIRNQQVLADQFAVASAAEELYLKRLRAKREVTAQQEAANRAANAAVDTVAEQAGWNQCLDSVLGSLRGYPNAGGDIDIMREVARIVREAKGTAADKPKIPPAYEHWISGKDWDDHESHKDL